MRKYKIGDRVIYNQPTHVHKSALPYGAKCLAVVISAFGGDDSAQAPTYRLLLDEVWTERENMAHVGERIVVGSVSEKYLSDVE